MKSIKGIAIYTAIILTISVAYFVYAYTKYPPTPERETFLSEVGEGFGEAGLWALSIIYIRTILKLVMGKGPLARRILPNYSPPAAASLFQRTVSFLDRTHIYVGVTTVAILMLHIVFMGVPMQILFFPAVIALVIWQGLFGMFLTWRYSPRELKKFSYLVHAQLTTGIMIGIFAYFGHVLVDN